MTFEPDPWNPTDQWSSDPESWESPYADDPFTDDSDSAALTPVAEDPAAPDPDVRFGSGGYSGSYDGIADCWFSSDGYVYAPDGTRVGAH
ncbi:hypothetical protein ACWDBD_31975 [Streptomyces sp. NPDC001118]|uniref:hypothetical protein n=1 Tax=unclassified Streptomyces TaxID=2593676 RepID=UPI003322A1AD